MRENEIHAAAKSSELNALLGRLYEHAEAHEHIAKKSDEQNQCVLDLRAAASRLEQMKVALQILHTWASVPGALNAEHVKAQCANALGMISNAEKKRITRSSKKGESS